MDKEQRRMKSVYYCETCAKLYSLSTETRTDLRKYSKCCFCGDCGSCTVELIDEKCEPSEMPKFKVGR